MRFCGSSISWPTASPAFAYAWGVQQIPSNSTQISLQGQCLSVNLYQAIAAAAGPVMSIAECESKTMAKSILQPRTTFHLRVKAFLLCSGIGVFGMRQGSGNLRQMHIVLWGPNFSTQQNAAPEDAECRQAGLH